ncbi:hypothetical protein HBH64_183440 [Parastagonospora nodorum]|nr:hypothetical protein HBI01_181480 [Parastagonospora nodorum]KAH4293063.1 hypothetical protein HBI02_185800 [Parastagonospora nodorum]KAH4323943.1 hypothetical protein HBI00_174280 [Parastagonospora nodorum]KAH4361115.1 hypothetical protein HBH94_186240 [Parastagonospora nodorum]KAH4456897.1 hypothetical protein HBH90_165530 [Parastagonospora nodorum]
MPSLERVLVTGGSGFLGSHIVEKLLDDPITSVAIISRNPRARTEDDRISLHPANIASKEEVQAIFDAFRPQVVIHAASPKSVDTAAELIRTNVQGTRVLLECAEACVDTRAFVYTSSDSAVEPSEELLTEDQAKLYGENRHPNPYAMSKAVADAAVQASNCAKLRTAAIRIPGIYGERDNNLMPQLVSSVRKNEHKMQIGQNKKLFEFVYVGKAAEAHILAARALLDPDTAIGVAGEAFFVSDGRAEPFFNFVRRCYAAMGHPVELNEVTVLPMMAMQMIASVTEWAYSIFTLGTVTPKLRRQNMDYLDKSCCWSIEKAKNRLGYEPVADQDAAIKRSMEWAVTKS